ncbi:MAG: acyl-CoA thioesterase II [Pseudomonadota bacterium]
MPDNALLYNSQEILDLLTLEKIDTDRYRGQSHFMGSPNVFGGQVLGQALYAAAATVPDKQPHSLHAMFILPGNHRLPIDYAVERVRDGGTFSTRQISAYQEGSKIFVMLASFQRSEAGLTHQKPMPPSVDPESMPCSVAAWRQHCIATNQPFHKVPVDLRLNSDDSLICSPSREPEKQMWMRSPLALPDSPLVHLCLFAYLSDYGLVTTSLQPHGLRVTDPRMQIASLDHSIWFHRPFRMDDWLLFDLETPNASGGRGLNTGHVFDRNGTLVATVAQEGLIRLRAN